MLTIPIRFDNENNQDSLILINYYAVAIGKHIEGYLPQCLENGS